MARRGAWGAFWLSLAVASMVAFAAPAAPAAPAAAPCSPTWRQMQAVSPGSYQNLPVGVVAVSRDDVWAVGEEDDRLGPLRTFAQHWDGTAWTHVPTPNPGAGGVLTSASGVASDDVWSVGYFFVGGVFHPLTLHWNGTRWRNVPNPGAVGSYLEGVRAIAADDAWAVGWNIKMHWDGAAWSTVEADQRALDVDASGPGDVWASGLPPELVRHFDGTSWVAGAQPVLPGTAGQWLYGIATAGPSDVWVAGGYADFGPGGVDDELPSRTLIAHLSSGAWTVTATANLGPSNNELNDVDFAAPGDGWAVGSTLETEPLLILRWEGSQWVLFGGETPVATARDGFTSAMTAVDALPDGTTYATGFTAREVGSTSLIERICPIRARDGGFEPETALARSRRPVAWSVPADAARGARVADGTGLGLFDSGHLEPGRGFHFSFPVSATYRIEGEAGAAPGAVEVPLTVTPDPGGDAYVVRWATHVPDGLVADVQIARPGSSTYEPWQTGTPAPSAAFPSPATPGRYRFRSRLRRPAGPTTAWSPVKILQVGPDP